MSVDSADDATETLKEVEPHRSSSSSNRNNGDNDADDADDADDNSTNDSEDNTMHSLQGSRADTVEASNLARGGGSSRGRSRQRSSKKKKKGSEGRRELRTKFQIESLYVEISELQRQNEVLKRLWSNVQQGSTDVVTSFGNLRLDRPTTTTTSSAASTTADHRVPRMVKVGDTSDTSRSHSDFENSLSDRSRSKNKKYDSDLDTSYKGGKYHSDEVDELSLDTHNLLYS